MLTLQLQDAQNQLPTDAVHVLIRSVASRWNENRQVLVWNLLVLQLKPERHWCLTDVLTRADMAYCNVLVLFQSLSYLILDETLWNLIWCFGSSMWHMPGSVQCIQDFCCAPVYLNLGRKIIWGNIFVDETVLASVAANHSLSQQVFSEWKLRPNI